MKYLFFFLLFFASTVKAQTTQDLKTDTTLSINFSVTPNIIGVAKNVISGIAAANSNANNAYAAAVNANNKALEASVTANGAVQVNSNQSLTLTTHTNQIASLQTQVNNIVIPPSAGIPKPIIKTSSFTVSDTCYLRTIYMNCNGCTVTLPACSPGLRFWVQAAGGTVYLSNPNGWVSGSTKQLSINGRPVMVEYKTDKITNAR